MQEKQFEGEALDDIGEIYGNCAGKKGK